LQGLHARCELCGEPTLVERDFDQLLQAKVEGVELVAEPPPNHNRGGGAVIGTMVLMFLGGGIGNALAGDLGGVVGFLLGLTPYRKHFWKMVVIKRPKLEAIVDPSSPRLADGRTRLAGTAQQHQATTPSPGSKREALAASVVVRAVRDPDVEVQSSELATKRYLVRAVTSAPFFLVAEGRRILVTGTVWVASKQAVRLAIDPFLVAQRLGLPRRYLPRYIVAEEAVVSADRRITVTGRLREERVPGLGYRDDVIETLRGEPADPVWITLV